MLPNVAVLSPGALLGLAVNRQPGYRRGRLAEPTKYHTAVKNDSWSAHLTDLCGGTRFFVNMYGACAEPCWTSHATCHPHVMSKYPSLHSDPECVANLRNLEVASHLKQCCTKRKMSNLKTIATSTKSMTTSNCHPKENYTSQSTKLSQ